ncbi:MAG: ribosome-associated translation inhibitor RaiA [Pseudomonadota bacterium]
MRYQISGKHIDIGNALQSRVKTDLDAVVDKFAQRPTEAQVTFSRDGHEYVCESSVHLSTGLTVNAKGRGGDIYGSFDSATERMEKQLRRYKRRLKDHHTQRRVPVEMIGAPAYILANDDAADDADEPDTLQPIIVAETQTKIKSLSVGEAVMQMELAGESVLVFRNEGQKRMNVVYKRTDGNIGWIDPE